MWYADIKSRKQTARVPAGRAGPQKGLVHSDHGSFPTHLVSHRPSWSWHWRSHNQRLAPVNFALLSRGAIGRRKGGELNENYDFYARAGFSLLKRTLPTEGTARLLRRSLSLGSDHHHGSNMALVPTGPRDGDAEIKRITAGRARGLLTIARYVRLRAIDKL